MSVPHEMVRLERILDYERVGLHSFAVNACANVYSAIFLHHPYKGALPYFRMYVRVKSMHSPMVVSSESCSTIQRILVNLPPLYPPNLLSAINFVHELTEKTAH